ncbi:MAG: type II toxin-antitoxin system prevent-host-death family antitoxin [Candidatus Riflebacteria bacterium]|nr:type II toxin-antitoxin system prevent-host-death family antitoxin [Candidatus Riflebacteria bacterium]
MPRRQAATELGVSEFKRRCLELLEGVHRSNLELVITKRGRPIARVVPLELVKAPLKGILGGQVQIEGDIVCVDWSEDWEALR